MMYAKRSNRVVQIAESEVNRYVEQGYTIVDEKGTVIKETVPTDLATLKLAYNKHIEEIKALKEENDTLKKEIESLKSKPSTKSTKAKVEKEETVE